VAFRGIASPVPSAVRVNTETVYSGRREAGVVMTSTGQMDIRDEHPALKVADPQAQRMVVLILRGMAQIIEALNPVRKEKTLAHPNPLPDEPEAALAINAIRTLLHYFDKRLK
jgi:abortive infection Abi-like protein